MTTKIAAIAAVLLALALGAGWWIHSKRLGQANEDLQSALDAETSENAIRLANAEDARDKAEEERDRAKSQLLKIRGQISELRAEATAAKNRTEELESERDRLNRGLSDLQERRDKDAARQEFQEWARAEMGHVKGMALGVALFVGGNNGRLPASIEEFAAFIPEKNRQADILADYELIDTGYERLEDIPNPGQVPVIRSKGPFMDDEDTQHWIYGFADGHSEIRNEPID